MTTQWTKWFLLFVEEKNVGTANLLAAQWDPDDGSTTFGSVKLSADGELPITYYATSTPATETMRDGITQALSVLSWASMYWTDNIQTETPHWIGPDGWAFDGDLWGAWVSSREAMGGLQVIQSDGP